MTGKATISMTKSNATWNMNMKIKISKKTRQKERVESEYATVFEFDEIF